MFAREPETQAIGRNLTGPHNYHRLDAVVARGPSVKPASREWGMNPQG